MGILNRKSGLTRRKFLRAGIPVTGLFVAACGSDRSFDAGDRPKLTEVQQRILEESIVVESAKSQPTQAALPHLPLKVHPLWSLFGATRSQYSGLIDRAASFDEVAPRLEMANFRQASEGMTLGETVALMADT
ncbi:MAG: hypothetical protein QF609_07315, partial [Gammaproteobacteria bacterium]|nr:hypothetical protein [Gammaproteobacteria bacterium]